MPKSSGPDSRWPPFPFAISQVQGIAVVWRWDGAHRVAGVRSVTAQPPSWDRSDSPYSQHPTLLCMGHDHLMPSNTGLKTEGLRIHHPVSHYQLPPVTPTAYLVPFFSF